jgi:ribosome-binding factor A
MRIANVYLSTFGGTETAQNKTFAAILHARSRIQGILAEQIQSRFCPVINIHRDENFKKSLEIMKLIDGLAAEFKDKDSVDQEHD